MYWKLQSKSDNNMVSAQDLLIGFSCWHQFKPHPVEKRQLQLDQSLEIKAGDRTETDLEVVS